MAKVNIKVINRKGQIVVKSDKGSEWRFKGLILPETAFSALIYQTVYMAFIRLDKNKDYTISLTMDINEDEKKDNGN